MESKHLLLPPISKRFHHSSSVETRPSAPFHKSRHNLTTTSEVHLSGTNLHKVDLSLSLESSLCRWRSVPNTYIPPYKTTQELVYSSYMKLNNISSSSQPTSKKYKFSIYSPDRFLTYIPNVYQRSVLPLDSISLERTDDSRADILPPVKIQRELNTIYIPLLPDKVRQPFNPCQLPSPLPLFRPLQKSKRNTKLHVFSLPIPDITAESGLSKHISPVLYRSNPHFHKLKVQKLIALRLSQIEMDSTHFAKMNPFRSSTYSNRMCNMNQFHLSNINSNELYVLGISNFKSNLSELFCSTYIPQISPFNPYSKTYPILTPLNRSENSSNTSPSLEESEPFNFTKIGNEASFHSPIQFSSDNSFLENNHLSHLNPFSFQSCSSHKFILQSSSRAYTDPTNSPHIRTSTSPSNKFNFNFNDTSSTTNMSLTNSTTDMSITSSATNVSLINSSTNMSLTNSLDPVTCSKISPILSTIDQSKHNSLQSLDIHPTSSPAHQNVPPNKSLLKPYVSPKQSQNNINSNMKFPEIFPSPANNKDQLQLKEVPGTWRVSSTSFAEKDASFPHDSNEVILSKVSQSLRDMNIIEDFEYEYLEIQRRNKTETLTQRLEDVMNNQANNGFSSNMHTIDSDIIKELEIDKHSDSKFKDIQLLNRIGSATFSVTNEVVDALSPAFVNKFVNELVFGIDFYNLITREHSRKSHVRTDGGSKDNIEYTKCSSRAGEKGRMPRQLHCATSRHTSFVARDLKLVKDQLRVNHKMRLIMKDLAKRKNVRQRLGNGLTDLFNITHAYTYSYYPSDIFTCVSFKGFSSAEDVNN